MATTYLNKTLAGTRTNGKKWTWSAWVKRNATGAIQPLFYADDGSANYYTTIRFHDTDSIVFRNKHSSDQGYLITTPVYRDPAAWYHIVAVYDSENSTSGDRMILYVNGERITAFDNEAYPGSSAGSTINDGYEHRIGRGNQVDGSSYLDGLMSHVHFSDGYAYSASDFGSTDATTGEWKINTAPSITMGINGFTILKDGNTITDQSSNSNNWSLGGGTLTATEDCPSNNFATWNNLANRETATNGATQIHPSGDASYTYSVSTLGASTGKYYFEFESNGGNGRALIGMVNSDYASEQIDNNQEPGANAHSFAYRQNQGDIQINNSTSSYGTQITWGTSANVLMMAVDLDNNKVWYGIDGTWQNSGDPSNGTNGFDWSAVRTAGDYYLVLAGDDTSSGYGNIQANFGNGVFGTTAISSEGTNASNIGKFEYDVPTGFTALSTKGLNE